MEYAVTYGLFSEAGKLAAEKTGGKLIKELVEAHLALAMGGLNPLVPAAVAGVAGGAGLGALAAGEGERVRGAARGALAGGLAGGGLAVLAPALTFRAMDVAAKLTKSRAHPQGNRDLGTAIMIGGLGAPMALGPLAGGIAGRTAREKAAGLESMIYRGDVAEAKKGRKHLVAMRKKRQARASAGGLRGWLAGRVDKASGKDIARHDAYIQKLEKTSKKKDGVGRAARDAAVLGAGFTAGYGAGGLAHYGMRKSKLKSGEKFRAMTPRQVTKLRRAAGLAGLGVGAATLSTRYARHRARAKDQERT